MPGIIDFETMHVDELPGIWSPVQWELSEDERVKEIEQQATASLLWTVDVPEALLRLLLCEAQIAQAHEPPKGFDPERQGDWDPDLTVFRFRRAIRLVQAERTVEALNVEYDFGELGHWLLEIGSEKVSIERI
jgi:hypothetical protein